jgi:small GTP-binding protein
MLYVPGDPYPINLTTLGDSSVGKTSLISALEGKQWSEDTRPTIGSAVSYLLFEGRNIRLGMHDTAGNEKHQVLTDIYVRNSQITLVCFALNSQTTFDNLPKWIEKINNICKPLPTMVLVGTKCDVEKDERVISAEAIEKFREEKGFEGYFETSAKEYLGIEELKTSLERFSEAWKPKPGDPTPTPTPTPELLPGDSGTKTGCCS